MVTDRADWSERTGRWAKRLIELDKPLLGVCYGHQLMAVVMGGTVGYPPDGRELGTLPVTLNARGCDEPWTGRLPPVFNGHLPDAQPVWVPPPGAQEQASSVHEPHP